MHGIFQLIIVDMNIIDLRKVYEVETLMHLSAGCLGYYRLSRSSVYIVRFNKHDAPWSRQKIFTWKHKAMRLKCGTQQYPSHSAPLDCLRMVVDDEKTS